MCKADSVDKMAQYTSIYKNLPIKEEQELHTRLCSLSCKSVSEFFLLLSGAIPPIFDFSISSQFLSFTLISVSIIHSRFFFSTLSLIELAHFIDTLVDFVF